MIFILKDSLSTEHLILNKVHVKMFNSTRTENNDTIDGITYNPLSSNDIDISRYDIDQRYSDQNQHYPQGKI